MNRSKLVSRSAAAIGVAAALSMASGFACAGTLNFSPTIFFSHSGTAYLADVDPVTNRAWVSPNIASGKIYGNIQTLCPGGTCTGSLAGLTWASDSAVNQFWGDIGIPLNGFGSFSAIGNLDPIFSPSGPDPSLLPLIGTLGPTNTTSNIFGTTYFLGGVTNDALTLGLPNSSYMFYFESSVSTAYDNESAFTYGTGNGYAEDGSTGGWFYFTPSTGGTTPVPEPGSLSMLGLGLGLLGLGFAWDQRRRRNRMDRTGGATDEGALA